MRILYFSSRLHASDGSSVHGREFAKALQGLGHAVMVYPAREQQGAVGRLPRLWSKVKRRARRRSRLAGAYCDLAEGAVVTGNAYLHCLRQARSFAPDVVVFRHYLFQLAPLLVARRLRVPAIVEVNAVKGVERRMGGARGTSQIVDMAERLAFRGADGGYAVSEEIRRQVVQAAGERPCFHVIPNGVDCARFDPALYDASEVKRQLGIDGKQVLGYVGSYQRWHGLPLLLEVMQALARESGQYHLLLIGDGAEFEPVRQMVKAKALGHCVTQLRRVPHEEIPRHLAAVDYALMTYPRLEPFYFSPLKLFEYLAMGKVVIATPLGQLSEVIDTGRNGWLVNAPEVTHFVAAVRTLASDGELRQRVQRAARANAVHHYSWEVNAARVVELCEAVIAERLRAQSGEMS